MNKRYKFQVGDIVAFTFMGLRFKFRNSVISYPECVTTGTFRTLHRLLSPV
nr:MAG TPA: hypothetical protein [Caudoviricetes sp.]